MLHKKSAISVSSPGTSFDTTGNFESKLLYLKNQEPKIIYSQVSMHCEVKCVAITPDEKLAVVGLENGEIQLINIITSDEEFESSAILKGHKAEVKCICITEDSQTIVSGSYDKNIIVWNIEDRSQKSILKGNEDKILSLAISKDNTLLVSGSIDNIIRIWDLKLELQKFIVRSIEANCYAICITSDSKNLVLGCSDNSIKIWNINEHCEEGKLIGHTWPVYSIALTTDNQFLVSSGMDHTIRKWDLSNYKQIDVLAEANETIYSLSITSDNLYVLYGKYNGDIGIIPLDRLSKEVTIEGNKSCINSICVSQSNRYILTGSRDGTVRISKLSESHEIQTLEGHTRRVYSLSISSDSRMMASASDDNTVIIWRLGLEDSEGVLKGHRGPVYDAIFTNNSKKCISGSQDQNIIIWDLSTDKPLNKLKGHGEAVTCLCVNSKDTFIVSGSFDKSIRVWDIESGAVLCIFNGHIEKITCIAINIDDKYIVSGSKDKSIRGWNILEKSEMLSIGEHEEEVTCLQLCFDNKILPNTSNFTKTPNIDIPEKENNGATLDVTLSEKIVSGSLDKTIRIWSFPNFIQLYVLGCKREVYKVSVCSNFEYMFIQTDKKYLKMWSISNKQELVTLYEQKEMNAIVLSYDKEWIAYSSKNLIQVVKSPLNKSSSYTVLPYKYSFLFKVFIYNLLNNDKSQNQTTFSKYFICSSNISLLHILTYASHNKMLKFAINNGAKFFRTKSGETPLSIALARKSKICAEILVKIFSNENCLENPYLFEYLEGLLPVLNQSSLPSLHILYKAAFPIVESSNLPTFGTFSAKPPVLGIFRSPIINVEYFIPSRYYGVYNLTDSEIEFRRSMISLDLSPGSEQSLTFLKSLLKCKNLEIFKTEFIKSVLKYKWRQIRWVLMVQSGLYSLLVLIITLNTVYQRDSIALVVIEIMINSLFLVYELSQAFSGFGSYLNDIWNLLDASRIIILYIYCVLTLSNAYLELEDILLTVINLVLWTRLVGYLRIFDSTRYLIHMIIQVIKDLGPFSIIFFLSNFAATFAFYSDNFGENFGSVLINTYSISYGAWDYSNYDDLSLTIFFLCSLMNTLILLNLLIAIVSDTYETVSDALEVVDMQELADIIIEVDSIIFWNRRKGSRMFLISCDIAGSNKINKKIEGNTTTILKLARGIDLKSKNTEKELEKVNQNLLKVSAANTSYKNDGVIELILGIKNDLKSFKNEIQSEMKQIKHDIESVKKEMKL